VVLLNSPYLSHILLPLYVSLSKFELYSVIFIVLEYKLCIYNLHCIWTYTSLCNILLLLLFSVSLLPVMLIYLHKCMNIFTVFM